MNALLLEIYSTIIPSAPFIIAAYALIWALLLIWMLIQFSRQKKLERELCVLEEELEALKFAQER